MGYEGANVLFDTWVHPLMMGLEEHLLGMFKDDFEFHESATASHLGGAGGAARAAEAIVAQPSDAPASGPISVQWDPEAERELGKIPFFVRGKAKRNTEAFASEQGLARITKDTLYEAKAHYAR
jgi:light-independent protochlorophyllide reductase subunit B